MIYDKNEKTGCYLSKGQFPVVDSSVLQSRWILWNPQYYIQVQPSLWV